MLCLRAKWLLTLLVWRGMRSVGEGKDGVWNGRGERWSVEWMEGRGREMKDVKGWEEDGGEGE
jgi:hypothetical protein